VKIRLNSSNGSGRHAFGKRSSHEAIIELLRFAEENHERGYIEFPRSCHFGELVEDGGFEVRSYYAQSSGAMILISAEEVQ
jgi:hypothetical protein